MTYVDAFWNKDKDIVEVVERDRQGNRIFQSFPAKYIFYYPDPKGKFTSIKGEPLSRISCRGWKDFLKEQKLNNHLKLYESDVSVVFRILEENYQNKPDPKLNIAFFDIETDMQPFAVESGTRVEIRDLNSGERKFITVFQLSQLSSAKSYKVFDTAVNEWVKISECSYLEPGPGYASPEDPFMPITAISLHLNWLDTLICLAMPPKHISMNEAKEMIKDFPNTFLFENEYDLLSTFLELIQDADIISGWNSEGFDVPYIVNRITRVLGKEETKKLCLWDLYPKRREYEKYGKDAVTYDFVGRIHLDSLELYRKYTYEERHSFSLDAIGEYELNERKTPYEGTLDELYNNDFRTFIEYNRQDTALLNKLNQKLKFIDLASKIAHENTVLIQTTMGAVAVTEQAIINEAHNKGLIIPNRTRKTSENNQAAGAHVAYPKKGLHKWIGSVDLNSLYPSAIRALNMGPETIIGQLRPEYTDAEISSKMAKGLSFAGAWEGKFGSNEYEFVMSQNKIHEIVVDWVDGKSTVMSGAQIYELIFNSNKPWLISANGTIFTYEKEGIIPGLLKRWYSERKLLQAELKKSISLASGISIESNLQARLTSVAKNDAMNEFSVNTTPSHIIKCIEERDIKALSDLIAAGVLKIQDSSITYASKAFATEQEEFWDKRQLVKKINLNSLYGALLNEGCRFFDKRIGQSTTLTGRAIARHMSSKINELITGDYDHTGKAIIYGDTDSSYFSAYPALKKEIDQGQIAWDKDTVIKLYNSIAEEVNSTFPDFMLKAFNCPYTRGDVIRAGREIVADRGLFITKKRYAVRYFDKENNRYDTDGKSGKIKAMGLDLKRSDTPVFVQQFLSKILEKVLDGALEPEILQMIRDFRTEFKALPGWEKGSPKRANKITEYREREARNGKITMPGHVRASINWNTLRTLNSDRYSRVIMDGMKVIVCSLKENPLGFTSVAYPVDELRLPKWFQDLPFDHNDMEEALIDAKIKNLIGVLDWDLDSTRSNSNFHSLFSFD